MTYNVISGGKETKSVFMEEARPEEEVERQSQETRRSREGRDRNTRNRGIWSAKCEEFPRVALSVTSIDMTSIYHRRGV